MGYLRLGCSNETLYNFVLGKYGCKQPKTSVTFSSDENVKLFKILENNSLQVEGYSVFFGVSPFILR